MGNIHTREFVDIYEYMIGNGVITVEVTDFHLLYNIWCEWQQKVIEIRRTNKVFGVYRAPLVIFDRLGGALSSDN